jgi:hypothetical protein
MRALSLALLISLLAGCVVDRDRGYNDFRFEGPHGRDTFDRPD